MDPRLRLLPAVAGLLLLLVVAQPVAAATPQTPLTFAQRIAQAKLVALVSVSGSPQAGYVLTVEQVFKGQAPSRLVYPPPQLQAAVAVEPGWTRVVIAFDNPTTLDFRANNIAWHVGPDGRIDPEHFQQFQGLPPTLAAMFAYFGLPATSTERPEPRDGPAPLSMLFVLLASVIAAVLTWRRVSDHEYR
jgi:hypothetical protein